MQNEIAVKIEGSGSGPVVSSSCAILVLVIFNHHVTVKDSRKGEMIMYILEVGICRLFF
jgi:hypothetical protein